MRLLTDLDDLGPNALDWPFEIRFVKPPFTEIEHGLGGIFAGIVPDCDRLRLADWPARPGPDRWHTLVIADEVHRSQYDALLAAVREIGAVPAPIAAVALTGHGFHGNRGRPWQACRGNLHLSCVLPVRLPAAACAAAVAAIPAVALCEAILATTSGVQPAIKWVNDILVGGGKVAGVLSATQSQGAELTGLAYGIGVNVSVTPPVVPTLFVPSATSLADHGDAPDLVTLLLALLERLADHVADLAAAGPGPIVAQYRRLCADIGREVALYAEGLHDTDDPGQLPAPLATGRVLGLDDHLALRIAGCPQPFHGGRLRHLD